MASCIAGLSNQTTGSGKRLPDFIIIGAAKSGTSSLARALSFHPQVYMSPVKEPDFFSNDENYSKGIEAYAALFEAARPDQICGEASTAYTRFPQHPHAAERIVGHLPCVKMIYLMRHPVDRAYSHYIHRYTKELHPDEPIAASFEEHVLRDPMCLDGSDYKLQLAQYLRFFSRESILPLLTQDFNRSQAGVLRQICQFLRIDEGFRFPPGAFAQANVGAVYKDIVVRRRIATAVKSIPGVTLLSSLLPKAVNTRLYQLIRRTPVGERVDRQMQARPMLPATRRELLDRYREATLWIENLVGRELPEWKV